MTPVDPSRRSAADLIRSLVYPTVPIIALICVWAYAYANALESRVHRDLEPRSDDSYFVPQPGIAGLKTRPVYRDPVVSLDDQN
jgi:hypothetical protein